MSFNKYMTIALAILSFLLFFSFFGSCLLLHFNYLFLSGNLLFLQKLLPLLIQLLLFGFNIEFDCFAAQFFGLPIQHQNSRDVLFSPHSLPFDELHVSFIIVFLLIFNQLVLDCDDILKTHVRIILNVKSKIRNKCTKLQLN